MIKNLDKTKLIIFTKANDCFMQEKTCVALYLFAAFIARWKIVIINAMF